MCGSDQVWSPVWLNPAYFLDFAQPGQKRVAYACSLGVAGIHDRKKRARLAQLVEPFQAVSIREEEGCMLMNELLPDKSIAVMPDPVFLPTREEWLRLAAPAKCADRLVCYFIGDTPASWVRVAGLSAELGLRPLIIPGTAQSYAEPYEKADGLSPQQWLGVLASAGHIVTDSFHGGAFAAVLGRPVTLLRRYRDDDPESKNSRIDQLARLLAWEPGETHTPAPDADDVLQGIRSRAVSWLRLALT